MSKMIENEDGTIQIHYDDKDFTADLPEAEASAERISSVVRSNATTGWISVKDSEPDSLDEVLTYSKNEGLGISFFSNGSWYDYGTTKWIDVTHWMPLPDAPEV